MPLMPVKAKDGPIGHLQDDGGDHEGLDDNLVNDDFEDNGYQRQENKEDDLDDDIKIEDDTLDYYTYDDDNE